MFKKICTLLTKIPFIKKIVDKRKQEKLQRDIDNLKTIRNTFEESCYGVKELVMLQNTLSNLDIDPALLDTLDRSKHVKFHSTTSQNLLEAVRKGYFHKETINRSKTLTLEPKSKPISCWLSNIESIAYLIEFTTTMLRKNIYIETAVLSKTEQNTIDEKITVSATEHEFINSLLYRLILSDFLTVVQLILDTKYETCERKKSNSP